MKEIVVLLASAIGTKDIRVNGAKFVTASIGDRIEVKDDEGAVVAVFMTDRIIGIHFADSLVKSQSTEAGDRDYMLLRDSAAANADRFTEECDRKAKEFGL